MWCTFCLETKVPRIAGPGEVSAGYPGLTQAMDIPVVPRIGEEVFLLLGEQRTRHMVTSVRYLLNIDKMVGVYVLVSAGSPIE